MRAASSWSESSTLYSGCGFALVVFAGADAKDSIERAHANESCDDEDQPEPCPWGLWADEGETNNAKARDDADNSVNGVFISGE